MKKKLLYVGALFATVICFLLYFYSFTNTQVDHLYLSVSDNDTNGWVCTVLSEGKEVPATALEAVHGKGTAILRRTITKEWTYFDRIYVDSGRAVCVFVDNQLVFANYRTDLTAPGELPLMQYPDNQPFLLTFAMNDNWLGKEITLVTRLYENNIYSGITLELNSDYVILTQHEVQVNSHALPGAMFGLLALLLFGVFLFELTTEHKGHATLLLALAALLQMFMNMSYLQENPLPALDHNLVMAVFFLLPLVYSGIKLTTTRTLYFKIILPLWALYFILYLVTYVFYLPLPSWADRTEFICVVAMCVLLFFCWRERKENAFALQYLRVLGLFAIGYLILFPISAVASPYLYMTMLSLLREAENMYWRPILSWLFSTLLFALFILTVWELLQSKVRDIREMGEMKLRNSLMSQSLLHAEQTNEALAVMRHDQIHHLRTLSQYIGEDTARATEYVTSLTKTLEQIPTMRFTKNRLINAVLCAELATANQAAVELTVKVLVADELPLPDQDLTTVLMNLLNNAIAAAAKTDPKKEKPRVSVTLSQDEEMLYIMISNSIPVDFNKEKLYDSALRSKKSSEEIHGWGIRSVRKLLSQYGGELHYQIGNEIVLNTVMQFPPKEAL